MNYILCDGGLANRLNTLLVGLYLKQHTGTPWCIAWPPNRWCGANLNDLFIPPLPVADFGLSYFKKFQRKFTFLFHENQIGFPEEKIFYHSKNERLEDLERLVQTNTPLVYFHNLIPAWFSNEKLAEMARALKVQPVIQQRVDHFVTSQGISKATVGIQIRKTDFGDKVNEEEIFKAVKASKKIFFVCSDSQAVEAKFAKLPNCAVHPKSYYPQTKTNDTNWNAVTTDEDGRTYPYNIQRSSDSVKEALVDFLILSKTNIMPVSGSTFQNLAIRFSALA